MEGEADRGEVWCFLLVFWGNASLSGSASEHRSGQEDHREVLSATTCRQWTLKMVMDLNLANQSRLRREQGKRRQEGGLLNVDFFFSINLEP